MYAEAMHFRFKKSLVFFQHGMMCIDELIEEQVGVIFERAGEYV